MYRVERWEYRDGEQGAETLPFLVSEWETWEQGLEGFVRALSESVNVGGGVVASSVHLGMSSASAHVSDAWSGEEWELVLALA